jgi:FixJ family two-component response regulator
MAHQQPEVVQAANGPPVLVVDDDPAVLNSLKFVLEIEGFPVRVFRSDEELIAAGTLPKSACLVVDYVLPGRNGLDLIAALRADGVGLPAILITSHPSAGVRQRAAAAGIPIVEKPLLGNALTEAIRRALGRA